MKIYYSKEPIEIICEGETITIDYKDSTLSDLPENNIKEVDFRSGKEKRRERRKQERNKKRLLK